ncbi:MAG: O-antigen ligase family protein, partial [Patescibacteria group bacterium]
LIVITQFISIFLLNKQFFYNLGKNKLIYSLFKSSVFLFLFISLIFIFLSLPLSNNGNKTCFLKIYRKDLCISVTENSRFFYWRQAYLTFKNNPIFGYGLDSFKHAARRFPLVNEQHSAYAHNIFLHNLAEMGVIGGGLFIFLIIYIFYQSISNLKKSKITVNNFLYIGAMSSLLNAMFDFDWHFFVIFLLTLIFLAFILRSRDSQKIEGKNDKFWKIFSSILFFASATLLIANVLTIRWQKKRPEYWLKYTPFYNISAEAPYDDSINTVETYSSLYDLYRYDTGFILRFLNFDKELDESLKLQLYLDLAEIDPASFVSKITYKDWGLNEAKILSDQLIRILEKHPPLNNNYFFGYWKRMELAKDLFNLAEEAYQKKDWQLANYFYQTAHLLDSYILFNQEGSYLKEENTDNLVEFLPYLQNISPFEIKDFNRYMFLYREVSTELFKQNRLEEFKKMTSSMIEHDPNAKWYLIDHLYNSLENEEQDLVLQEIE